MTQLTTFLTIVIALSVAAERIVEIVKGLLPNFWLFKSGSTPTSEDRRCALMHCFAGVCGGAAAYASKVDLLTYLHNPTAAPTTPPTPESWQQVISAFLAAALLTSAGSAFWNHILDIINATKVQQESAAINAANPVAPPRAPGGAPASMTLA
jgi:hypothetical protein